MFWRIEFSGNAPALPETEDKEVQKVRRRRPGGCLSTIILTIALAAAAVLVYNMLFPPKNGEETLIDQALHLVGIGKQEEKEDQPDGPEPQTADQQDTEEENGEEETSTPPIADLPSVDAIRVDITQDKLRELLEEAMQSSFPLTLDEVVIASDATLTFTGSAQRDKFLELAKEQAGGELSAYVMLLQLAPENLEFTCKVGVTYDAGAGQVSLDPQKLTVAGYDVPTNLLPASVTDSLNQALTNFFADYGRKPTGLTLYDGYLSVFFE